MFFVSERKQASFYSALKVATSFLKKRDHTVPYFLWKLECSFLQKKIEPYDIRKFQFNYHNQTIALLCSDILMHRTCFLPALRLSLPWRLCLRVTTMRHILYSLPTSHLLTFSLIQTTIFPSQFCSSFLRFIPVSFFQPFYFPKCAPWTFTTI